MQNLSVSVLTFYVCAFSACDSSKKSALQVDAGEEVDAGGDSGLIDERQKLCAARDGWAANTIVKTDFKAALCRFSGFFAAAASGAVASAALSAECTQVQSACIADTDADVPTAEAACDLPATCDITANELQTCMGEWVERMKATLALFPACETLAPSDLEPQRLAQSANFYVRPVSCTALESKCPGLLR